MDIFLEFYNFSWKPININKIGALIVYSKYHIKGNIYINHIKGYLN